MYVDFDDLPVMFEYLEGNEQILIAVPVAQVPDENREVFYAGLLQGQFLFHGTGGATLALDPKEEFVNLQIVRDLQTLTPPDFIVLVEGFLQTADFWAKRCAETGAKPSEAGAESGGDGEEAFPANMLRI